jgi:hypothetical protein
MTGAVSMRVLCAFLVCGAVTSHAAVVRNAESLAAAVADGGTVKIASGPITLSEPLTIDRDTVIEAHSGRATLSGGDAVRLFQVSSNVKLTLIGLNLVHGRSTNGGAIYNDGGELVIIDCRFLNNLAVGMEALAGIRGTNATTNVASRPGDGGRGGSGQSARGGAIYSRGIVRVWSSIFENNTALASEGGPGADGGDAGRTGGPGGGGDGGDGANAEGGAVFSDGVAEILSTSLIGNAARSSSGGQGGSPGTNEIRMYGARLWGNAGVSGSARGGAVFARGALRASNSMFQSNQVVGADGLPGLAGHGGAAVYAKGIDGRDGKNGGDALGGAVFAEGQLSAERTTFERNSAIAGYGGDGGSGGVAVINGNGSQPGGNGGRPAPGGSAQGGAIAVEGRVTCAAAGIAYNTAVAGAGGNGGDGGAAGGSFLSPPLARDGAPAGIAAGGGIFQSGGQFILSETHINANVVRAGSGGRGGRAGRGNYGSTSPSGSPGNAAPAGAAFGGGIHAVGTAEVRRVTIAFNGAYAATGSNGIAGSGSSKIGNSGTHGAQGGSAFGGGAWFGNETALIESSVISNQVVGGDGGNGGFGSQGMYTQSRGGSGGFGGQALGAGFHSEAGIAAINCTVAGNAAFSGNGGAGAGGDSSPSWFDYDEQPRDSAGAGGTGGSGSGGISIGTNSTAAFSYCTIASNMVVIGAGGFGPTNQFNPQGRWGGAGTNLGAIAAWGSATFAACIVAGNDALNASGAIIDAGFNLCSDVSCGFTDPSSLVNADPQLLPWADNGGSTPAMAIAATSPARDAVLSGSCPETDQRGYPRPSGAACDIGAFEFDAEPADSSSGAAIVGRIMDGAIGLAAVRVRIGKQTVLTDENGAYRVDGLKPGKYLIKPKAARVRFQPQFRRVRVDQGTSVADFVLKRHLAPR